MTDSPLFEVISFLVLDTILAVCIIIDWIIKKYNALDDFFPEWKDTNKKKIWAIIWIVCIYLNIGIPCIGFAYESTLTLTRILILSTVGYYLLLSLVYFVVKHNLRHYYDKKLEQRRLKRLAELEQEKNASYNESDITGSSDVTKTKE